MAPGIAEQASRRTQLDRDDEPLATAVVAGSRANSPELAAFDLTIDDSDSNTVHDSAVVLAMSHAEDVHDQLSFNKGSPLIEGGDVRAS